jgi:predicted nucleic acid-binding protein
VTVPDVVGLDTNCLVYFLEHSDPGRAAYLETHVFEPMSRGAVKGVTSSLTLAELLVPMYRAHAPGDAAAFRAGPEALDGLSMLPVTDDVADLSAEIRGQTGLKLADAVQVATARLAGASALLTNDRRLDRPGVGIAVVVLDDVLDV